MTNQRFLNDNEVEKIDSALYVAITNHVNSFIANWEEQCESEAEAEALEFVLNSHYPAWRVREDGTIDVVVHGDSRDFFNFEWEDEEGVEMESNALDLLAGCVSHEFDDDCNNDIAFDRELENKIIALFK